MGGAGAEMALPGCRRWQRGSGVGAAAAAAAAAVAAARTALPPSCLLGSSRRSGSCCNPRRNRRPQSRRSCQSGRGRGTCQRPWGPLRPWGHLVGAAGQRASESRVSKVLLCPCYLENRPRVGVSAAVHCSAMHAQVLHDNWPFSASSGAAPRLTGPIHHNNGRRSDRAIDKAASSPHGAELVDPTRQRQKCRPRAAEEKLHEAPWSSLSLPKRDKRQRQDRSGRMQGLEQPSAVLVLPFPQPAEPAEWLGLGTLVSKPSSHI
jgi:hypothetical protein